MDLEMPVVGSDTALEEQARRATCLSSACRPMRLPASARRRSRPDVTSSIPSRWSLLGCWAKFASCLADGWRKLREAQRAWDLRLTDTGFIEGETVATVWPRIRSDGCRRWQHLKDRSRGGTRGPMSKERLTSVDATRPGYG